MGRFVVPVLAADLNCGPGLAENYFHAFEKFGFRDIPTGITWDRVNPHVKNGQFPTDPSAAIDHVMVLDRQVPARADVLFSEAENLLSDHYAVAAELALD